MATVEDEIRDLKKKNSELVQKVQYWKLTAATKENEKLELMKEINELRLKLGRLRSGGAAQARKLDAALQSASEEALSHLVQASNAVARTLELAKTYMQDRQDLDNSSPRWSAIGGSPKTERVHRVPPMMMGGQSIQPVVSLSRTIFNVSNSMSASRTTNVNRNITERAVPMHVLQDVYIPLRRIDASDFPGNNMELEMEDNNEEDSAEDDLEDSAERSGDDLQNISEGDEFDASRRLDAVTEEPEPEDERLTPPRRSRAENPLEGPSWLLDCPTATRSRPKSLKSRTLEPDSTTEPEENALVDPPIIQINELEANVAAPAFTPTVRRRKRTSSPPRPPSLSPLVCSPPARGAHSAAAARRLSTSGRVLKVLVAKMRLDSGDGDKSDTDDVTPPKRPSLSSPVRDSPTKRLMRFDAPSPNGATDAGVIVSEDTIEDRENDHAWREMKVTVARRDSHDSRKNQERLVNVDTRDRRLVSTDNSHRVGNTSHNRLANHVLENGEVDTGDRGGIRDSAVDSDDSVEQNIDKRKCVVDRQRNGSNCVGNGNSSRLVSVGESSRLGSVGDSRLGSVADRDSDSSSNGQVGEGRTRRPRKAVTYKEKPLNRKMRR